jgi:hypothetical protein
VVEKQPRRARSRRMTPENVVPADQAEERFARQPSQQ